MDDELLAEILAAEREIRQEIESLERQTADRLERLKNELGRTLEAETRALLAETELAMDISGKRAEEEAETVLAEARAYALRLEMLDNVKLDTLLARYLTRIHPEGRDDRKNEQA